MSLPANLDGPAQPRSPRGENIPATVSVIMPVYNPDEKLHRALKTLQAQTMQDWEAIVVDDGSVADLSWVEDIDRRIRLIRQPQSGVSTARNVGIAASTAPWIAFLDHDDEWYSAKLERQLDAIARAERDAPGTTAFAHTAFEWVWPTTVVPHRYQKPLNYRGLLRGDHVCASTVLASRDAVIAAGAFNPLLKMGEDTDLWLRLTVTGRRPVVVDEVLARYHMHETNSSRDYWSGLIDRRVVLRLHSARAKRRGDQQSVAACRSGMATARRLAGTQAFDAARQALAQREKSVGLHLGRALVLQPAYTVRSCGQWLRTRSILGADVP